MRRLSLALFCVLALLGVDADACTPTSATDPYQWTTVGEGSIWTGCSGGSPDGGDAFVIDQGEVIVDNVFGGTPIQMIAGSITVAGGTLRLGGGSKITWSGDGYLHLRGGVLELAGEERARGRIQAITWAEGGGTETATITVPGAVANVAAAGDFVLFADEDPVNKTHPISKPMQIGPGVSHGYYRASNEKWRWYQITAVSGSTITYSTDAYGDLESGADAAIYGGTRGQALSADTAISTNVRQPHGLSTKITFADGVPSQLVRQDLTDQYLEFTSGVCDGRFAKILYTTDNTSPTEDDIYVAGDVSECGTANAQINFGARVGDLVRIVRSADIDFGNTAHFRWSGGTLRVSLARLEHLDDQSSTVISATLAGNCNICIYAESGSVRPDFANSYVMDTEVAFGNSAAGESGVFMILGLDNTSAALRHGAALDMAGFVAERIYVHDQMVNQSAFGLHAVFANGITNFEPTRWRVERIGDDGAYVGLDSDSTGVAQVNEFRHWIVQALRPTTSNSQQCLDLTAADALAGSVSEKVFSKTHVYDALLVGCSEGIGNNGYGAVWQRIATGGLGSGVSTAGGISMGVNAPSVVPPANTVGLYPNIIRDSMLGMYQTPGSTTLVRVGGEIQNTVLYGNDLRTASNNLLDFSTISQSFLDISQTSGSEEMTNRSSTSSTYVHLQVPTVRLIDTALLGGRVITGASNLLQRNFGGSGYYTAPVKSDLDLTRVFFSTRLVTRVHGFLQDFVLSSDTTGDQQVTANGLVLTVNSTASGNGLGCGWAVGSGFCAATGEGANITNACIESNIDATAVAAFGAARTASSRHLPSMGPDSTDHATPSTSIATIRAFVGDGRNPQSVCDFLARPRVLGLSTFGTEQALLGDFVAAQIDNWTTDEKLLQSFGSGASTRPVYPSNVSP